MQRDALALNHVMRPLRSSLRTPSKTRDVTRISPLSSHSTLSCPLALAAFSASSRVSAFITSCHAFWYLSFELARSSSTRVYVTPPFSWIF